MPDGPSNQKSDNSNPVGGPPENIPVVGQGVKNIPPPPDPFAAAENPKTIPIEKSPGLSPMLSVPQPEPPPIPVSASTSAPIEMKQSQPRGGEKFDPEPTQKEGPSEPVRPIESLTPPPPLRMELSPEIKETIQAVRGVEQAQRRKKTAILLILLLVLLGTGAAAAYFFIIPTLQTPPPEVNNNLDVSSLLKPTESPPPPITPPPTPKIRSEKGFGNLPPIDFSAWTIKGLDLSLLVVSNEATVSAEITEKNGQADVYLLKNEIGEASPSAVFWLENKREIVGIKNFNSSEFQEAIKDSSKSRYPLKEANVAVEQILSATKISGGGLSKIDLIKNPLKGLTLTAMELVYFRSPPYLIPVYVAEADGLQKGSSQKIKLFFFGEALAP